MRKGEPHELTLLLDFANSLDVGDGRDDLSNPDALADWLSRRQLISGAERPTAEELLLAHRLRAGLRRVLASHHGGAVSESLITELDDLGAALPLRMAFPAGEPELVAVAGGVRGALARIVADILLARCRGSWTRLKICPGDDCAWVFYDQSKNLSRRWCSMGVCGNRTKVRAYRSRKSP